MFQSYPGFTTTSLLFLYQAMRIGINLYFHLKKGTSGYLSYCRDISVKGTPERTHLPHFCVLIPSDPDVVSLGFDLANFLKIVIVCN